MAHSTRAKSPRKRSKTKEAIKPAGKPVLAISGVGVAPAKATVEFYKARKAEPWEPESRKAPIPAVGILSATVPGMFDGLLLALAEHGTMSFAQVSAPAIEYAGGFPIGEEFVKVGIYFTQVATTGCGWAPRAQQHI